MQILLLTIFFDINTTKRNSNDLETYYMWPISLCLYLFNTEKFRSEITLKGTLDVISIFTASMEKIWIH